VPGGRQGPSLTVLEGDEAAAEVRKLSRLADRQRRTDGSPGFRYRRQLVIWWWALIWAAGFIARAAHWDAVAVGLGALLVTGATVAGARGAGDFTRPVLNGATVWACCQMIIAWLAGRGWWTGIGLLGWGAFAALWLNHHGWRPPAPQDKKPETDAEIFAELAEAQKWDARLLLPAREIANGVQYEIRCNGRRMDIGQVLAKPEKIAAAFGSRLDECYVENHPSGEHHRGILTRLRSATLETPREWDGQGIDLATGTARVGRFPDADAHEMWWLPGKGGGIKHCFATGCDGSGKTSAIDLSLCIAVTSRHAGRGIVAPVILDPQAGQSLPAWVDHVPTARGVTECLAWLEAVYQAMFARSEQLARFRWKLLADKKTAVPADDPRPGRVRKGIGFFDPVLTGLPIILIVIDECPVLLKIPGVEGKLTEIAKLGRKCGFRLLLAAQVPSVKEMKSAELRSILNGGNQFMFRAGDKVTEGMMNMPAKPNLIPKFFRDGRPTQGLGHASTIEQRPRAPYRSDFEPDPYEVAETADIERPDETVAARMREVIEAENVSAEELARLAGEQERAMVTLLGLLERGPVEWGQLVMDSGLRASVAGAAFARLAAEGKARRDGDLAEAVT